MEEAHKYNWAARKIRSNDVKWSAIQKLSQRYPTALFEMSKYWSLNEKDFALLCDFSGNEMMALGDCEEREYNANKPGWVMTGTKEDDKKVVLTEGEFNDQMARFPSLYGSRLTYRLYKESSECREKFLAMPVMY